LPVKKRPLGRTKKLTHRERRVLELVAQGRRNQEIAAELGVTALSIRNDLGAIYKKIGVSTRVELTLWYWAQQQEGTSLP
jgi:DNA-binding CsgD family transcriptional regulator